MDNVISDYGKMKGCVGADTTMVSKVYLLRNRYRSSAVSCLNFQDCNKQLAMLLFAVIFANAIEVYCLM